MSELKAGDRMMAIISDGPDFTGWVSIGDDANRCRVHPDALHPLPPALSAEDVAAWKETVRDIFDRLHGGRESVFSGSYLAKELVAMIERNHADYFTASGARVAAQAEGEKVAEHWPDEEVDLHGEGTPEDAATADAVDRADEDARRVPDVAMLEKAVVAEFDKAVAEAERNRPGVPWTPNFHTAVHALHALRAALTPPAPVDPVEVENRILRKALTKIRDINLGPDQASASWRVQEAASIAGAALSRERK